MKIYTGRGDYGNTNLIGGKTVYKDNLRLEAYGSLDELNSLVGWLIALCHKEKELLTLTNELSLLQHHIYDAGTDLADPSGKLEERLTEDITKWLEARIDHYDSLTQPIEKFILPGGHEAAAVAQYARTVTRRAERKLVSLMKEEEISKNAFIFVNRLSDYFFIAGRYINEVMKVEEPFYDRGGTVFHLDD
ncbi:MAG: cob(I)yrinic acid a,c-diamide adenosyltransferase [Atopococcus tabaci]|uniref:Corrinoid adenosyltransferase n=1 Tax=Atopococcus tabaci TaxID=269774 RepID=A0AA43UCM3_9LACT|nr:cob(I)yrinic acid a,c-diamide adenosyltransferase [Atopococcus tabaci]